MKTLIKVDTAEKITNSIMNNLNKFLAIILLTGLTVTAIFTPTVHPAIYEDCGKFETYGEKVEFKKLLRKHGLDRDVSVVCNDGNGWYFMRDGRRCEFK